MAAAFKCDDKVTIEQLTGAVDPEYGTEVMVWAVVALNYWANVQDVLPSRGESVQNGLAKSVQQTRLRMRKGVAISTKMRVTLHTRGNRVMQIISGPALLDDRIHEEFMLESFANG